MIVTDGFDGLIQVFNLRAPIELAWKIQFPFSLATSFGQGMSSRLDRAFVSIPCQKCRVPDSFTLAGRPRAEGGAERCPKGTPPSCQLASNLCIQRHLNAVAKGREREREREVHCHSVSQSVCPLLSQFV